MSVATVITSARVVNLVDVSGGDHSIACKAFYVGTAGNISFIPALGGNTISTLPVDKGYHPIEVKTFVQSGTSASNILALNW